MKKVGNIDFEWMGPRFFFSKNSGELQDDETGALMDALEERIREEPYFLWEIDVSELSGMTPSARRIAAERLRRLPDRAIAIIHAKFAQRILVKLVLTAVAMLDGSQRNNKVSFFNDHESAAKWLHEYAENYTHAQGES